MASVPKSFISSYLRNRNNPTAPPPAPAPAPAPAASPPPKGKTKPNPKPARAARPTKKRKHGFFRTALKAVAGEVLRGTGHLGKHVVHKIAEDAAGSGGMPTNNASSGAVAGLGTGPQEPGVKKRKRVPALSYSVFKRTKGTDA